MYKEVLLLYQDNY